MNWKWPIVKLLSQRRSTAKLLALHELSKESSYLAKVGWFDSFYCDSAVDREQRAVPWLTYPAIAFINGRLQKEMSLFEYGSGNSTLWWAERVSSVVSCEHDPVWHDKMAARVPQNVDYLFAQVDDGYCEVIRQYKEEFDVLIIDGRERVKCIRNSLGALKAKGVVVWDNSEREKYQPGFQFLSDAGFRRIDFWGIGPIYADSWCTSVFYRNNNCFEI